MFPRPKIQTSSRLIICDRAAESFRQARPLADDAISAIAGLDERAAPEALEGRPRVAVRGNEMRFLSWLHAETDNIICRHIALLPGPRGASRALASGCGSRVSLDRQVKKR
jgi:hypothetical protein